MRVKFKAAVEMDCVEMDLTALQVDRAGSRPVRGLVAPAEVVAAGKTPVGGLASDLGGAWWLVLCRV